MITLQLHVPVGSWPIPGPRHTRDSYPFAPPSTAYGCLLSLIGEFDMRRHLNAKIGVGVLYNPTPNHHGKITLQPPRPYAQFRMRNKTKKPSNPSDPSNKRPDTQPIYAHIDQLIWIDSSQETQSPNLETRVQHALDSPHDVSRSGPLSLGESHWLILQIDTLNPQTIQERGASIFIPQPSGPYSMTTWCDYKSLTTTHYQPGSIAFCNDYHQLHHHTSSIQAPPHVTHHKSKK